MEKTQARSDTKAGAQWVSLLSWKVWWGKVPRQVSKKTKRNKDGVEEAKNGQ